MKTLITSLGAGMYKEGYRQTTYRFANGNEYPTKLFIEAILDEDPGIGKVILIGTHTSSRDVSVKTMPRFGHLSKNSVNLPPGCRTKHTLTSGSA